MRLSGAGAASARATGRAAQLIWCGQKAVAFAGRLLGPTRQPTGANLAARVPRIACAATSVVGQPDRIPA